MESAEQADHGSLVERPAVGPDDDEHPDKPGNGRKPGAPPYLLPEQKHCGQDHEERGGKADRGRIGARQPGGGVKARDHGGNPTAPRRKWP